MNPRKTQQGVILITVMLIILTAGAFVLLKALNVAANKSDYNRAQTRSALREAKLALLGYAVHDPALGLGPGRLPCPDKDGDGQLLVGELSCSLGGANPTTGWLPYFAIGTSRLSDAAGAELWYAVADSHRNTLLASINSDTGDATNDLSVDSEDGIIAVIIAPGPAIGNQDRSSGATISDYLEGDNASRGDGSFVTIDSAPFNDDLITITRAELMAAVEKRVLGEVNRRLNEYYALYSGYPWPSPYADPISKANFSESIGGTEGHLPVHQDGEEFPAGFSLLWDIPSDGTLDALTGPQDACMRWSQCDDDDVDIAFDFFPVTIIGGRCTWSSAEAFDCTATTTRTVAGGELVRTYQIELSGITPTVSAPTATSGRLRHFVLLGAMPTGSLGTISIIDTLDGIARGSRRTLDLAPGDLVNISLQNVPFWIGDDRDIVADATNSPAALPRWLTANQWHHHVYYAFSAADAIGTAGDCDPLLTPCLTLEVTRVGGNTMANSKIRGLAIIAGRGLTGLPRGNAMSDYFEAENNQIGTPNTTFSRAPLSTIFTDQISILGSVP